MQLFCLRLLLVTSLVISSLDYGATFAMSPSSSSSLKMSLTPSKPNNKKTMVLKWIESIRGGDIDTPKEVPPITPQPVTKNIMKQGMAFSGSLLPNLRNLFAGSSESYARGWRELQHFHHIGDLVILATFSILPIYISRLYYVVYYQIAVKFGKERKDYEQSRISTTGKFISQGGQIASLVYLVELLTTFALSVMTNAPKAAKPVAQAVVPKNLLALQKFPGLFSHCVYGIWLANKAVQLKSRILRNSYKRLPDPETYDNVMNFLIYIVASILVLESSQFDLGALVKSLVAVGGLSSIVVGLALRDPATHLLQGALLMLANKFHRNDTIRLGDGTEGKVVDIGLLETTIMGGNDIQIKIPNSKLGGQNFSNISRMQRSQVKFDLRFHLYDMPRIQAIIAAIHEEVVASCPKLITDGSRPFRVLWTDIGADHVVVTVDTHHNIPPACNAYWENRQKLLLAISTATMKMNAKFAMPVTVNAEFQETRSGS